MLDSVAHFFTLTDSKHTNTSTQLDWSEKKIPHSARICYTLSIFRSLEPVKRCLTISFMLTEMPKCGIWLLDVNV